jgi:hypothetical protein
MTGVKRGRDNSDIFVQLFRNQLLPIIHVILHYSATGNAFQVFWSCSSVTITTSTTKSINILLYKISAWFRFSIGFQRLIAMIISKPGYGSSFSELGRGGRDRPVSSYSPSRTISLLEQSLWSANHILRTAVMGTIALGQWKNHSFHRGCKDRLWVMGTGGPELTLREKLSLCIFSPSCVRLQS